MLVKINRATFYDWSAGKYRKIGTYSDIVKTWRETCKNFVIDRLHNNNGKADVNLIFIAKASYQMRETSPIPPVETENKRVLTAAELPKLGSVDTCEVPLPDLTE